MAAAAAQEKALAAQVAAFGTFAEGCRWAGTDGHRMLPPLTRDLLAEREGDRAAMGAREPSAVSQAAGDFADRQAWLVAPAGGFSTRYGCREIGHVPVAELDAAWRRVGTRMWPFSALGRRAVPRHLASYAKGKVDSARDLAMLSDLQDGLAALEKSPLTALPGWAGRENRRRSDAGHGGAGLQSGP